MNNTIQSILQLKGCVVHGVNSRAMVSDAVAVMCERHVGCVVVIDEGVLLGTFSERDLTHGVVSRGLDASTTRVRDVMTRSVVCVSADLAVDEAMALVTQRHLRHLPVVEGARVVGVVSVGDLVRWALDDRDRTIDQLQDYVLGRNPG